MRRKTFTKVLAMILSLSMVFTMNPVMANEDIITNEKNQEKKNENYAEGEAIIMYNSESTSAKRAMSNSLGDDMEILDTYIFQQNNANANARSTTEEKDLSVSLVKSDKYSTEELIEKLNKKSNIKYTEPNYKIKKLDYNDTYYKHQWSQENKGQNAGLEDLDINADTDLLADKDNKERVIALVDTGIDYTHEDLKDVVWNNPYNNKKLYGEHGYDFINYDADPMDDNGHGSHCSGVMAGKANNETGIAGTAKSENIKIMGLKILDEEGYGYGMEAVGAYNYIYKAQQLGVNVVAVNNSWGGADEEESEILKTLIDMVGEKGAISVCAAGNEGTDNDEVESIPADIDSDYVVSVAASNEKDELASFSNYGKKSVDIAAPGTDILSSVSYNCFNPSIYDNVSEVCGTYQNFDTGSLVDTINKNGYTGNVAASGDIAYGTDASGDGEVQVSVTNEQYFGGKSDTNKSLKWTITGAKADNYYYLYLPYNVKQSDTEIYAGMALKINGPSMSLGEIENFEDFLNLSCLNFADYKLDDNGIFNMTDIEDDVIDYMDIENDNYWTNYSTIVSKRANQNEKHIFVFAIYAGTDGDYSVSIDNFGISKENVTSDKFGKYDYYNGTSMAAPHVTGAIAAVANAYPKESALQVKARVLGSVRKSGDLKDKVATGGVLDLSKVENPSMLVEKAELNSKNQIEIRGYYMDKAQVYVDNKKVDVISNDGKCIVVDGSQYINKQITIKVEKDNLTYAEDYFFTKGKAFSEGSSISGIMRGGQLLSGGDSMIYIDSYGLVSYGFPYQDEETNKEIFLWSEGGNEFEGKTFGKEYEQAVDYTIYNDTDYVYTNKKIYGILSIDVGYATDKILAVYDEEKGWSKLADIPDEMYDFEGSTLTAYNGDLYLIGGINENEDLSNKVMKYSVSEKKWINVVNIPESRAFSQAIQVGKKLIVTLGCNGKNEIPKNLIFDGKNWTVSKAKQQKSIDTYALEFETKQLYITTAQIGLIKDGIIYTNLRVENMGDTFIYNVSNDTFTASQYALGASELEYDNLFATTVGDKLYVIYGEEYVDMDDEEEFWSMKSEDDLGFFDDELEGSISSLYIPITSGYVNVVDNSEIGGYVDGAGTYLPGDTITLKAMAEDSEMIIEKFLVNGKSIAKGKNGYVYTANASDCPNKMTTEVVVSYGDFDITVPKLTKVKISKAKRSKNKKKIGITLKKVKGAKGYQIKYSTSKKFGKKVTKTVTSKKLKVTLNKLKAKKKYYIKVRAYTRFYGEKIYGKWSKVKVVKVKKAKKK